jgi:hypothetical protein
MKLFTQAPHFVWLRASMALVASLRGALVASFRGARHNEPWLLDSGLRRNDGKGVV